MCISSKFSWKRVAGVACGRENLGGGLLQELEHVRTAEGRSQGDERARGG